MSEIAISIQGVTKKFKLPHEKHKSVKSKIINSPFKKTYTIQEALKSVSFEIRKGEFFGIVGRNGSGKSTLLKCMAGVYTPDKGAITVNGTLVPFIELGVGFNPELTGRDNVFLNGALLGFSQKEMEGLYDEIVEFAELEPYMDQKLKNYSSGMQVRLAFSIAIQAKGDILLLDEVLAVGDSIFQQKCFNYFQNLKKTNQTVLLVSHSIEALRQFCTRGVLLENGSVVSEGPINDVLNDYIDILGGEETKSFEKQTKNSKKKNNKEVNKRHGSGKVRIKDIFTVGDGETKRTFNDKNDNLIIEGRYKATENVESPIFGIVVRDAAGNRIFSSNNKWLDIKARDLSKGDSITVVWEIPNFFNTGMYTINAAVADSSGLEVFDSIDDVLSFQVRKQKPNSSLTNITHKLTLS